MNLISLLKTFCLFIFASLLINTGNACSTFTLSNKSSEIVFGKNFDYPTGLGYITENKRNVFKTSALPANQKKLEWTSKYGSISFNQFGAEFPYGGMNEAGLVIEQMWFDDTEYAEDDSRYRLSALQWIQYQLDMSNSIEDVIKSDDFLTIKNTKITLHFLICDKYGETATIEYIAGKMLCHKGKSLPIPALTNVSYPNSLKYLHKFKGFGGTAQIKPSSDPYDRFVVIADKLKNYNPKYKFVDYSFETLKSVSNTSTQWSIIYDVSNKIIYFKTKENNQIRSFELNSFNFDNKTPRLNLNIDAPLESVAQSFIPYSSETNLKHLQRVYGSLEMFKNITPTQIENLAKYPDTIILK